MGRRRGLKAVIEESRSERGSYEKKNKGMGGTIFAKI